MRELVNTTVQQPRRIDLFKSKGHSTVVFHQQATTRLNNRIDRVVAELKQRLELPKSGNEKIKQLKNELEAAVESHEPAHEIEHHGEKYAPGLG